MEATNRGGAVRDSKLLNRASLQRGLIDYAIGYVAKRDTVPIVIEEKDKERVVHQAWDGEMPILIQLIYFEGVTPEDFKWFTKDYMTRIQEITSASVLKITEIMVEDGCKIAHQRVCPPVPFVSPRSSVICYYFKEDGEDHNHTFCYSTRGNEAMAEAMAEEFGEDVYSDVEVNLVKAVARKDSTGKIIGTEITNVIAQNPNGSMPRFLVDQMTKH